MPPKTKPPNSTNIENPLPSTPQLQAHCHSHASTSLTRTSQPLEKRKWQSTWFHHEAMFAYTFITQIAHPSSIFEALSSPKASWWHKAMQGEYGSLINNKSWTLVDQPANQYVINTNWLFGCKYNCKYTLARHLFKSLYGLKQAPRIWCEFFDKFLQSQGLV